MKQTILQFLDFSKKERTGIYVLLFVSTCIWVLPVFFSNENIDMSTVEVTMLDSKIRKLKNDSLGYSASHLHESANHVNAYSNIDTQSLFYFDPNTIGKQEWIKLGVKEKTAETILRYVTAGGRFRDKHDLTKIFGLRPYQIERLMPYVVLSEVKEHFRNKPIYKKKEIQQIHIDLNTADSNSLMLAPGIGQKLAGRVIKYRDRLGGFVSIGQLSEVYGITDSLLIRLQSIWFVSLPLQVKKLKVNSIDLEELKKHPYVSFSMSKHILAYRKSHGRIADSDEMNGIVGIDREKLARLIPYLEY
jgi:DNA uptake protein ComE-like DNA-binding protein